MLPLLPDFTSVYSTCLNFFREYDFLKISFHIVFGVIITLYISWMIGKISQKRISAHHSQLLRRLTFYVGLAFAFLIPLKASGIDVTALLGAAGILTAAVAFAAQTSISNFLSGVFLIAEKPFEVGDLVTINDTFGEVLSIDLLSVKLRTKDNTFVRIPNESLLKSQFKNLTRFPVRRCDIKLRFNAHEDLTRIKNILLEVARRNPLSLVAPAPELQFIGFEDSVVILQFCVWGKQSSFSSLQTNIQMEIQAAFIAHNIKLPTGIQIMTLSSV